MANEFVPIRSVKQYIKEFGVEGIAKGANKELVRKQLLDAFQKEIFGQIVMRYHDPALLSRPYEYIDEETRIGIRHILENTNRKWKRLCMEFAKYKETHSLILPDDLMLYLKDVVHIQEQEREEPDAEVYIDESEPIETHILEVANS